MALRLPVSAKLKLQDWFVNCSTPLTSCRQAFYAHVVRLTVGSVKHLLEHWDNHSKIPLVLPIAINDLISRNRILTGNRIQMTGINQCY